MQWLKLSNEKLLKAVAVAVLAVVGVGMGMGVHKMRELNTHYSMSQFMPKDHPLYNSDRLVKKTFRINEREPMIVNLVLGEGAKGTWLTKARMANLERATSEMAKIENIEKVLSLSNVEVANATEKEGIQVDRLVGMVPQDKWADRILKDPLIAPGLISKDGRAVTLIADMPPVTENQMNDVMAQVRTRLGKIASEQGATVMVSGVLPVQTQITTLLSKELVNFFGLAFLVCLVTLLCYFRSLSTVFVCLVLVIIANIATFTCLAVLGIPFSVLSSALPIICSIEALAIGSHTLLIFGDNYRLAMNQPNPPSKAHVVWTTYRSLLFPNFLMSTTTIIGFATLVLSQVPLIRQFSQSVSAGILMSCICMSIALPSLMYLFPIPVARSWTGAKARWALWVIHHRRMVVFGVMAGVVILFAGVGTSLNWSVRLYDDLPKVGDLQKSTDLMDHKLGGMIPLDLMIKQEGEENPWNEPVRIQKLKDVLAKWRKDPAVGSVIGLPDFLNTGIQSLDSRKAVAETIFLYGFSGADNPIAHFLSNDGESTRLSFRMKDVDADRMSTAIRKITADVKRTFPGSDVYAGGMAAMVHPLNAELSSDLIYGLWHSLVLISILLILVFRSVRLALIAAVPNLLPPLALLLTMSYLKTPIKPVVAIIFSIALGLAYNNTVFLLTRLKKIQQTFKGAADVIMRTWYQEGNPCLFSSLAVIGGFAVFLASYFTPNRTFGAYMLWSIGVGLIGDLIFLPALLRMFPWFIFPGDAEPVKAKSRPRPRMALMIFALAIGMGPSAAAAADNVVRSPFLLTMKKAEFARLLHDNVIAKATKGQQVISLNPIVVTNPFEVQVSGIKVKLNYQLDAPQNPNNPSEWNLKSRRMNAEILVDSVEAHQTIRVVNGEDVVNVRIDGSCRDVKLALPEGTASASGKLTLTQTAGTPRLVLQNFKADWVPGSWQAVSMDCTGPQGFGEVVRNEALKQLQRIDPYRAELAKGIQDQLDQASLAKDIDIAFTNPLQNGQNIRLLAPPSRADENGDMRVRGDAYFTFASVRGECGAEVREFPAEPRPRVGEAALYVPLATLKAILACTHSDRSLAFRASSKDFPAFQQLMASHMAKDAVWPDLNNFNDTSIFHFAGNSAAAPQLSNEKSAGANLISANLIQPLDVDMYAPRGGTLVPYVGALATYSGPVQISVVDGAVNIKPEKAGKLTVSGGFVPSYVAKYHPTGAINWAKITPSLQQSLLSKGWTFALPQQDLNSTVRLKFGSGDLQGANFRLNYTIIRK